MKDVSRRIDRPMAPFSSIRRASKTLCSRGWETRCSSRLLGGARASSSLRTGAVAAAWFVGPPPHRWVLRHYRRGGRPRGCRAIVCLAGRGAGARVRRVPPARRLEPARPSRAGAHRRALPAQRFHLPLRSHHPADRDGAAHERAARRRRVERGDVARRRRRGRLPASRGRRSSGSQRAQRVDRLRRLRCASSTSIAAGCASPAGRTSRGLSATSSDCGARSRK